MSQFDLQNYRSRWMTIPMSIVRKRVKFDKGTSRTPDVMTPFLRSYWDDFTSRYRRYELLDLYASNQIYSNLVTYAQLYLRTRKLYKYIRGVYNPAHRLRETYVSRLYGGSLDMKNLTAGAIGIQGASPEVKDAIRQIWKWSDWGANKSLYARYCAGLGDVLLHIVDDPVDQKVKIEVVHPENLVYADFDPSGNITEALIGYERLDNPDDPLSRPYWYELYMGPEEFITFRDGEEYAYGEDGDGNPVARWDNIYGFVPLRLVRFADIGKRYGQAPIQDMLWKVDEINDQASHLNDQTRKSVNPIWALLGVTQKTNIDLEIQNKDEIPMLDFPPGVDIKPMIPQLQLTEGLDNIRMMLEELENDLPVLALHRVRNGGYATAPGIRAAFTDAIDQLTEARGMMNRGIVIAHEMAITIGAIRDYPGFEGINEQAYDRGDLEHWIADKPMIDDSLSKKETLDLMISTGVPKKLVWANLGLSDEDIDEALAEAEQNEAAAMDRALAALLGQNGEDNAEEDDETAPSNRDDETDPGEDEEETSASSNANGS